MSGARVIQLVMAREIRHRLRARSFPIVTGLLCLAVLGAGVLHRALSGDDAPPSYDVAAVGALPDGFEAALQQAADTLGIDVEVGSAPNRAAADAALRDGDIDVAVDVTEAQLVSDGEPPDQLAAAVSAAWQAASARDAATAAGLDDEQIREILAPAPLEATVLDDDDDDTVAYLVGFISAVLLFISINAFGGMVLTGVVEEKTTGVVEVLLAHVRAHQLLAGKVFGIGVVALIQFAAAVVAGIVALRISGTSVPTDVWIGLPTNIGWFIGGFVLYSTLFAVAGSFVSRQEDAQGASAPISVVFTAAYIAVFALGSDPETTVARVVSVLPPFAPLLMPLRVAAGAASVVEIVLAVVLLLVAMAGMLRLAGSIYGRTLLHRGARLGWRDALRMRSV